jgi:pimeloyl-ACP methyl ester carboxylesterase
MPTRPRAPDRIRLSLYYVATYLTTAGLGMTFAPQLTLDWMFSNGRYELVFVRMCGLFVLGLAAIVIATIRHRLVALYPTIIGVRVGFCAGYVVLYTQTRDPFFLATLAIVGAGLVARSIAFAIDRHARSPRVYRAEPAPPRTIDANGIRFAALEWGAGSGPVVLLLHGFPDTAHTWDELGPELARAGYHVVAPFLRGYPPSETPNRDADAETLGRDVLGLIDAIGGGAKIRVIGHDWGAEAAQAAAALAPDRFDRMVTIAIPHRAAIPLTPRLMWKLRHFITLKLPGAERRFAADDYAMVEVLYRRWSPTWNYTEADLDAAKNLLAAPGALHAALGYYRAAEIRTPGFLRALVDVPTLAIAGADDPNASPALFESVRRQFRAPYQVTAIPGGHFCHRESPRECLAAILPFLA